MLLRTLTFNVSYNEKVCTYSLSDLSLLQETVMCDSKYWDVDLSVSTVEGEADMLIKVPDLGKVTIIVAISLKLLNIQSTTH